MAIIKYSIDGAVNPSSLVTWLNTNKEGTFLENATITSEQIENNIPKYKMTITFGTDVIQFFTWGESSTQSTGDASNWYITKFNDTAILKMNPYNGANAQYCRSLYRTSILSTNGLLIGYTARIGTGSTMYNYKISYHTPLLLTLDNNGNLTAITPQVNPICGCLTSGTTDRGSYMSAEINGYTFTNNNVPDGTKVILQPSANVYATALQRFTGYDTSGNGYYTPFAYYSTATQFTPNDQSTLGVVMLNNTKYVTNGRWFIKDAD